MKRNPSGAPRDIGLMQLAIASGKGTYFLTQVKCPVSARDTGAEVGDWICARDGPPR